MRDSRTSGENRNTKKGFSVESKSPRENGARKKMAGPGLVWTRPRLQNSTYISYITTWREEN